MFSETVVVGSIYVFDSRESISFSSALSIESIILLLRKPSQRLSNNPLVPFKNYKITSRSYYCLLWYINRYKECQKILFKIVAKRRLFAKKVNTSNISQ